jgi:molybdopterin converting factor small subunit
MKVKVKFFATFREVFGAEKEIELESGSTIQDLLNVLCDSRRCRQKIFDRSGKLKPYIKILKNGRNIPLFEDTRIELEGKRIQFLGGIHTELEDGDVVAIFPPVGGG